MKTDPLITAAILEVFVDMLLELDSLAEKGPIDRRDVRDVIIRPARDKVAGLLVNGVQS